MISSPQKVKDIDDLILNEVQEDLHLDYKASPALHKNCRDELSKDVSAFANSDGGIIIYGVIEKDNLPVSKDSGVEHKKLTREWLEQVISSNITPRIDGIKIKQIRLNSERSIYVISIPRSDRAPHQARDRKYYKRNNFESVAMEDYEINDVRNRRNVVLPLINVDVDSKGGSIMAYFKVSNVGLLPALNVTFSYPENIRWLEGRKTPTLFKQGTKYFPPQKTFYFLWNAFPTLIRSEDESDRKCDIAVTYLHPQTGKIVTDTFHIDLDVYRENSRLKSNTQELQETLKESLKNLAEGLKKLNSNIEQFSSIGGNTGLELSVTSLRNLRNIISGDGKLEKISPEHRSYLVFKEVLNINEDLAYNLEIHFAYYHQEGKKLEDVKGISPEVISELKKYFLVDE